jgi:hypothetical protein
MLVVPIWAGLLHQAFAMVVLAMAAVHARRLAGEGLQGGERRSRIRAEP